ncbi:MAG: 2-oxoglutarate dehydrogenase E1 component [Myxococcota bacterium]
MASTQNQPGQAVDFNSLLTGDNAAFIDFLYNRWLNNPSDVEPAWAELFAQWDTAPTNGTLSGAEHHPQPPSIFHARADANGLSNGAHHGVAAHSDDAVMTVARRQARAAQLINAYRVRGHIEADIDPLGLRKIEEHPELTLGYYGLSEADLDVPISGTGVYGVPEVTTLRHVITRLRRAYCSSFGVEFMNINDINKKRWLQERLETMQDTDPLNDEEERYAFRLLADAENFENMLHTRYPGTKRFSIEGAEPLIPLMSMLIDEASARGVDRVVLGMAHRGRLNVLANILYKPVRAILDEFEDTSKMTVQGSGDVKYHLGYSSYYPTRNGQKVRVTLAFNPSHLEAVNPIVEGRARARQDRGVEGDAHNIMPMLLHGDAAFAGQGLVAEVLNLSQLRAYKTGGTVHVIINNQIGFTTSPEDARSTPYSSDVARMLAIPIFHVNGEDVEAVVAVARLAAEWRQTFKEDVVIDMYSFRKYGHNEGDEPMFTQPLLYDAIRKHPTPREVFARKIVEHGAVTQEEIDHIFADSKQRLQSHLNEPSPDDLDQDGTDTLMKRLWQDYLYGTLDDEVDTTVDIDRLKALLHKANQIPDGFNAHRKIKRLLSQRLDAVEGTRPVDWAVGEQAAYASLVDQGFRVRLVGQDAGRGTFSHRHAVLTDTTNGDEFIPLNNLTDRQAPFEVYDSLLSEAAALGFEVGYSYDYPDALVIWEAQFGDFANGAQVIIDNFIMSTEQKWGRNSGVVMLLPHGYEGQGPEHSSARLERYLQLCAEDNVTVANCSTPASFFHLMRRQVVIGVRKPLVVMSPKSLLRHPRCISTVEDLANGRFEPVLPDPMSPAANTRRAVFCSGKVYYDLLDAREQAGVEGVAIIRLEQLYPFPAAQVKAILDEMPDDVEIVWCQEEPRNMGAWPMMDEWMGEVLGGRPPRYIGRKSSASPATGSPSSHKQEQQRLLHEAISFDS